jgi:hypothetical protein
MSCPTNCPRVLRKSRKNDSLYANRVLNVIPSEHGAKCHPIHRDVRTDASKACENGSS